MFSLHKETERIFSVGGNFYIYDSAFESAGYVAIVVRETCQSDENNRKLSELGYTYQGAYTKIAKAIYYTIPIEKLERLQAES